MRRSTRLVLAAMFGAAATRAAGVDATTLEGKVLLGYQGWFNCEGDGASGNDWRTTNPWMTWFRNGIAPGAQTVDNYPDLTEFDRSDLCAVPGFTIGGRPAYLYSAWNPHVIDRHFQWMEEYGLDGVLVQRFINRAATRRASGDVVLKHIMAAAKRHGRTFAIEYDVSGAPPARFFDMLREDWQYLVRDLRVTSAPGYLHHQGKPVLSFWGMGFLQAHPPEDPADAARVVAWLRDEAPRECRVTYVGGVPARWRSLTGDSRTAPGWAGVYARMDAIQPWTVGRYRDEESAGRWKQEVLSGDLALTRERGQLYMPVIFPGFSWANLNGKQKGAQPNQIPRRGGRFLRRQAVNARQADATLLKNRDVRRGQ